MTAQSHKGFGAVIRRNREARGLTQRQLANVAMISIGTLRDVEQGRTRSPRWPLAQRLIDALSIDDSQLEHLLGTSPLEGRTAAATTETGVTSPYRPSRLRIQLLGQVAVYRDNEQVALGSMRQRCILALLALENRRGVKPSVIIDTLWSDSPPKSATAMVHHYVWQLRKAFGLDSSRTDSGRTLITTGADHYRLDATNLQLDSAAFQRLFFQASEAERKDHDADALALYGEALAVWRGDVVADIDLLHAHAAAVQLAATRADAVMRFAELAIPAGASSHALPHLQSLCSKDPFNERAHAQLMTALAATGQRARALNVFADLRLRLSEELAIAPGRLATAARASILNL
jgi:DNA-binding SARP family transcriptional activator/DNA-binding XRE family transcriptional regulator